MTDLHLVWDWNGTLLDDLEVVVESVNAGLAWQGAGPIDADGYRNHYVRPVSRFYETLLGRRLSDTEWRRINDIFHEAYFARVTRARLTFDAEEALERGRARGWSQSVLSMAPHDHLVEIVSHHRIVGYFAAVEGSRGDRGAEKAAALVTHVDRLGVSPDRVVVIGDIPDDAHAAFHVGAHAVLYDGGSHHRDDLEAVGVPVATSLREAVDLARHLTGPG